MEDMKAIQYLKVTPHEKEGYSKIIQSSSLGGPDIVYEVPNEMVEDVIKEMEQSWKNAMESLFKQDSLIEGVDLLKLRDPVDE